MLRTYWPLFLMTAPFVLILIGIIVRQVTLPRTDYSGIGADRYFDISENEEKKKMSRIAFVTLFFIISFSVIFLFSENGVGSILLSQQLAESFGISSLGFYLGKLASRNSRRTWIELIWFQVLNFVCMLSAIAAKAAGVGVAYKAAVPLMLAFIVSFLVFLAVGNKKQIEPEVPEKK